MTGPPGAGKTLLAQALPSSLPHMLNDEALDVTALTRWPTRHRRGFRWCTAAIPLAASHDLACRSGRGANYPRSGEISAQHGSTLRLDWQRYSLMTPIGLDQAGEADLLARGQARPATALLLGRQASTGDVWLTVIDPRLVLVSPAAGSGWPSSEILARLTSRSVLRTDVNGTTTVETDGVML